MPGTVNDAGILTSRDGEHHLAIAIFAKASKRDQTAGTTVATTAATVRSLMMSDL